MIVFGMTLSTFGAYVFIALLMISLYILLGVLYVIFGVVSTLIKDLWLKLTTKRKH